MEWKTKALLLAAAAGGVYWQNVWVDHSRRVISDSRLPKSFDGFTILHLSDLHFGLSSFARRQTLSRKYGRPDVIAVTGDLLDRYDPEWLRAAADWVKQAVKIAPVYFVPGNHEARAKEHYPAVRETLEQAGAKVLEDRGVLWKRSGEAIALLGIRDPQFFETKEGFSHAIHRLAQGKPEFSILLSHRPERLAQYAKEGFSLVLSGHAHGGQVRLPGIGGLYAPDQGIFPRYTSGVYRLGSTRMVVSRGIGTNFCCPRLLNRPEAATIVLRRNRQERKHRDGFSGI